jgi:hypothetical protein
MPMLAFLRFTANFEHLVELDFSYVRNVTFPPAFYKALLHSQVFHLKHFNCLDLQDLQNVLVIIYTPATRPHNIEVNLSSTPSNL